MSNEKLNVKGFYRLALQEDGKTVKDTGWVQNQVTNAGVDGFLLSWLGAGTGKSVGYMGIGTGTAPAKTDTSLNGELTHSASRVSVASSLITSDASSRILQFTATFNAGYLTATANVANIGLFDSGSGGTLFSGATFTSSAIASNQALLASAQIRIAN